MNTRIRESADILWNYNKVNHDAVLPDSAEVVIALGCRDLGVAHRATEAYREVGAAAIVFTGANGRYTKGVFAKSEAEVFADEALKLGVPEDAILLEKQATNTGENIRFSHSVLEGMGKTAVRSIVLVQRPFIERRILATAEAQWPDIEKVDLHVTSQDFDFDGYRAHMNFDEHDLVGYLVDATWRVMDYPKLGFQTEQPMSSEVLAAYEALKTAGYGTNLPLTA